jgi:hypothetical protein
MWPSGKCHQIEACYEEFLRLRLGVHGLDLDQGLGNFKLSACLCPKHYGKIGGAWLCTAPDSHSIFMLRYRFWVTVVDSYYVLL